VHSVYSIEVGLGLIIAAIYMYLKVVHSERATTTDLVTRTTTCTKRSVCTQQSVASQDVDIQAGVYPWPGSAAL